MERIQLASCGRPSVRSPRPHLRALSRATARIKCAMRGAPCISGSATRLSKKSAMRRLRAASWARTVGERSLDASFRASIPKCRRTCCAPRTRVGGKPNWVHVADRGSEAYRRGCREHGAIALPIFPSITHPGHGRIIWRSNFATASAGRARQLNGKCHRSRSGFGGGPTNDCLRDAKNIATKPRCYRESIDLLATWFSM